MGMKLPLPRPRLLLLPPPAWQPAAAPAEVRVPGRDSGGPVTQTETSLVTVDQPGRQ